MVLTNLVRFVGIGLLAYGINSDDAGLVAVYVVGFGLGVAETFFDTSAEAFTPQLVGADDLPSANARLQGLEFVAGQLAGPPLGAFLFAVAASLPFFFDGATFFVAALLIAWIPGAYRSERVVVQTMRKDIGEGLRWLWGQRVIRTLVMSAGAINLIMFSFFAIFVLFAQDILMTSDFTYGLLLAIVGVGGLVGAIIAPRIISALGPGTTLRINIGIAAVIFPLTGLTSSVWVVAVLGFVFVMGLAGWNVISVSLRQRLTPDALRGRVSGAARLLAWGTQPLGAILGGVLAAAFGLRSPFLVGGVGFLVLLIVTWRVFSNETIEVAGAAGPGPTEAV
jgi:predicted MFS family arabinose efflux permease